MSRIAYASLGKRGEFSRDPRYADISPIAAAQAIDQEDTSEKAYRAGFSDGQASARADFDAAIATERKERAAIELAFARFDAESERMLRDRLLSTVQVLCEEAVLPFALDKSGIARRVEMAAAMLQRQHDERKIHIHPADLELVRDHVPADLELIADSTIERGGLRIETIDGGVEDGPTQWRRTLSELLETCSS